MSDEQYQIEDVSEVEKASAPAVEEAEDRAAAAGFPPDSGPEQDVISIREAMVTAAPLRFVILCAMVLAAVVGGIWLAIDKRTILAALVGVVGLVVVGYLLTWKVLTYANSLKITNKRTIHRRGLFDKSTSEVLHDNIRNVQIDQKLWERIFNVGSLGISSAGQDEIEVQMTKVPRPEKVRRIIDLYRPLG
ncbi:MAG: PH domain-containing protein [Planctomycetota bacterium]